MATAAIVLSSCGTMGFGTSMGAMIGGTLGSIAGDAAGGWHGSSIGGMVGSIAGMAVGAAIEEQQPCLCATLWPWASTRATKWTGT